MSNYFDNQTNWSWQVNNGKAEVVTHHTNPKPHSHTVDVTDVSIGEMAENTSKVMGEAHRAASHDYEATESSGKEGKMAEKNSNSFLESIRCDEATIAKTNEVARSFSQKASTTKGKADDGGRERGDDGPGKLGRESGYKTGSSHVAAIRADMMSTGKSSSSQGKDGQSAGKSAGSTAHSTSAKGGSATGGKTGAVSTGGVSTGGKSGVSGVSTGGLSGGHGSAGGSSGGHGSAGGGHGGGGSAGGGGHGGGGSGGGHGGH